MIDSHCHLDSHQYGESQEELVAEATAAGVHTLVTIGADLPSSHATVELASRFPSVYATVGIHPHDATTLTPHALATLRELATRKKVVAIGEIGLDYYRDLSPRSVQREAFIQQLELAVTLKLPVVIHTREAFEDTIAIVRDFSARLPGGVFHCFPGSARDAEIVFGLGFVISVGGQVTYKNSVMSQTIAGVPLDRVLLETDAPYLTPVPFRGKTNRPAYVTHVCQKVAELHRLSAGEVERITDSNSRRLFRLAETFAG